MDAYLGFLLHVADRFCQVNLVRIVHAMFLKDRKQVGIKLLVDAFSLIRPLCADAIYQISRGAVSLGGAQLLQASTWPSRISIILPRFRNRPSSRSPTSNWLSIITT